MISIVNIIFNINKFIINQYETNVFFKWATDWFAIIYKKIMLFYRPHNIEPFCNNWCSLSMITSQPRYDVDCRTHDLITVEKCKFTEKYLFDLDKNEMIDNYECVLQFAKQSVIDTSPQKNNKLIIVKTHKNEYVVKLLQNYLKNITLNYLFTPKKTEQSNVKFLTVEYFQKNNKNPITLEIPKSMFLVGNELFSPTFVYRCLQYQDVPFYFDTTYELNIIDHNINVITLTSDTHVILHKYNYEVVRD